MRRLDWAKAQPSVNILRTKVSTHVGPGVADPASWSQASRSSAGNAPVSSLLAQIGNVSDCFSYEVETSQVAVAYADNVLIVDM